MPESASKAVPVISAEPLGLIVELSAGEVTAAVGASISVLAIEKAWLIGQTDSPLP